MAPQTTEDPLLEVRDLRTYFYTDQGVVRSVDGVSYRINRGRTLGVVGESGCGKSVGAMSILRLIPQPPGRIVGGQILFEGRDLTQVSDEAMRRIRGNEIAVIFQEPMTSLNPVFTIGDQIIEAVELHTEMRGDDARAHAIEMLRKVGIPAPEARVDEYPHQLSGGMRQRVMIAMALSCNPKLLIADEPTTALDVTIQAQILDLLNDLRRDTGMAILMITHDLGVVAETCDDVVVLYAGQMAETAAADELFNNPVHPYTIGLLGSLPDAQEDTEHDLSTIPGMVPSPLDFPEGCRFRTRCSYADATCAQVPPREEATPGHMVACHHWRKVQTDHRSSS